jgi:hypothetical protein
MSGDDRRVVRTELTSFRAGRDTNRREGLQELPRLTEEAGDYDEIQ